MKKIIQILKQKWVEYLFEIIVIIVGILVALALDNWNDSRKNKIEEAKVLINIRKVLTDDIIRLREFMVYHEIRNTNNENLLRVLERGTILDKDSLDLLFGSVYGISGFSLNISPFEALKYKGMEVITNDSISALIIEVYEIRQRDLEFLKGLENNITLELMRPYYMNNFFNIKFGISATPIDLDKVLSDKYYYNITQYLLTAHRGWSNRFDFTLSKMVKLNELINKYLEE